ncbi:MAG: riboflavin synthase [bacterium]|nr:riboflavin synthase [bacterium]
MFTGLIEDVGNVVSIMGAGRGKTFRIRSYSINLAVGDSIAVNGVCLTVCKITGKDFEVYVSPETLLETNLLGLTSGSKVNLERALCITDRLGGHIVQGHVDGVCTVVGRKVFGKTIFSTTLLSISPPKELFHYIVNKGSIAIDGVSLTVREIKDNSFSVALVPYTLKNTTLGNLKVGDKVNLEVDIIAKYLRWQNLVQ